MRPGFWIWICLLAWPAYQAFQGGAWPYWTGWAGVAAFGVLFALLVQLVLPGPARPLIGALLLAALTALGFVCYLTFGASWVVAFYLMVMAWAIAAATPVAAAAVGLIAALAGILGWRQGQDPPTAAMVAFTVLASGAANILILHFLALIQELRGPDRSWPAWRWPRSEFASHGTCTICSGTVSR